MLTLAKRTLFKSVFAMASVVLIIGCKEDGCGVPVEKSLDLTVKKSMLMLSMEGNKKADPAAFLADPTLVWDEIDLTFTVKGKHSVKTPLTLSVNGLKLTRKDGQAVTEEMLFSSKKNSTNARIKLSKVYVNGGESFASFLAKLKMNKGTLRLQLAGTVIGNTKIAGNEISDAVLTLKGRSTKACPTPTPASSPTPTPTPTPTPVPESPVTTLVSADPSAALTSSTTMMLQFSSSIAGSTFWCSLDQAMPVTCASPQTYSNLASGAHQFQVYSQSPQGAVEKQPVVYNWTVDAIKPSVTITNAASLATLTKLDSVYFEFSASKAGSTFKCNLDGGSYIACSSPKSYSALSEGVHTFAVTAVDSLGNVSASPATFKWSIDRTPPELSFTDVVPAAALSNSLSKSFTFMASESSQFECSLDGASFGSCSSPAQVENLTEGNHRYEVRAMDAAGNQSATISYTWDVDVTAPEVTLGIVSPLAGLTNSKSLSVEFAVDEAATTVCSVDGGPAVECVSPWTGAGMSEGDHSVRITAVDLAGNISQSQSVQWTLDFTAPMISLGEVLPSASSLLNVNAVSVAINMPAGASLQVSVDGGAWGVSSNPLSLSALSEGNHALVFMATDAAGNQSESLTYSFAIDMTAPVLAMQTELPGSLLNLDRNSFALTSNEDGVFECSMDGAGFAPCESPVQVSGLADGDHLMQVRAIDLAGNISAIGEHRWSVDTIAPTTSVVTKQNSNAVTFTLSASEASATFVCSFDGSPLGPCSSPVSYSSLAAGTHSFIAKAVDAAGNVDPVGAMSSVLVVEPITTTLISAVPSQISTNLTSMTFTFVASQANATFLCSIDGGAPVVCQSPYTYSGIQDGQHSFSVKAVDTYGNIDPVGATHTWGVDTQAPVVSNWVTTPTTNTITVTWTTDEPSTTQVRYGFGFLVSQSTSEMPQLVYTHSVKLSGLSSNSTYTIQIYSRDALGNAYLSATRTVKTLR